MNDRSRRRLFVLRIVVVSLLATLSGRLWYLQVLAGGQYSAAAAENGVREVISPATRGQILDDKGVPLVRNRTALVVSVDRAALPPGSAARETVLRRLAGVIGLSYDDLRQRIQICGGAVKPPCWNGSPYQPVPVKDDATPVIALAIAEHREDFPGVTAALAGVRDYPQGMLAAHSLGYLSPISDTELKDPRYRDYQRTDLIGRSGLEQTNDATLRGQPGVRAVTVDHVGTVTGVRRETPAVPGDNLVLNLDAGVQKVTEDALAAAMTSARATTDRDGSRFRAPTGAAVVLAAKTGRVVALASAPSYDPSVFVGGISTADFQALNDPAANVPLLSRATQGQFAPGSTFKIVSTTAAVTDGASTRGIYSCPSSFDIGGQSFQNFEGETLGPLTLHTALVKSCDTIFYQFGYNEWLADEARIKAKQPPTQPMVTMAKAFGFGQPTGIDLPGESAGQMVDRAYKLADWQARKADYCAGAKSRPKGDYLQRIDAEDCVDGYVYRGVRHRELQRRHQRVALTDGEQHRVTAAVDVAVDTVLRIDALQVVALGPGLGTGAVVGLTSLPVRELVGPVDHLAGRLAGQVDAGGLAEPERLGHGDHGLGRRLLGLDPGLVGQPLVVAELIEDRVTGLDQRRVQRQRPEGLALEVLEALTTDVERGWAAVDAFGRGAVGHGGRGGHDLEGGPGGELALGRSGQQRDVGGRVVQGLEVGGGDAPDEHARIVARGAGQGHHPTGLGRQHHRRPGRRPEARAVPVGRRPSTGHGGGQRVLGDLLHASVQVEHQVVARHGRSLASYAGDRAHVIHRHRAHARLAAHS